MSVTDKSSSAVPDVLAVIYQSFSVIVKIFYRRDNNIMLDVSGVYSQYVAFYVHN